MEVTVTTQRDGSNEIVTKYQGLVGDNLKHEDLVELAEEFWPYVKSDDDFFEDFEDLELQYIENGVRFYGIDLDDEGYNTHVWVKFVTIFS